MIASIVMSSLCCRDVHAMGLFKGYSKLDRCSSGSRMCSGKLMPTSQNVRAVHDHLRASANQVWTWYAFTFYEQLHIISSAGPSLISAIVLFTRLNSKYPLYLRRLSGNFQVRTLAGTNHFLQSTLTCETINFHLFPFLLFPIHIHLSRPDLVCQSFLAIETAHRWTVSSQRRLSIQQNVCQRYHLAYKRRHQ